MEIMEVPLILFTGHIYVFLSTEIKNRIKKIDSVYGVMANLTFRGSKFHFNI